METASKLHKIWAVCLWKSGLWLNFPTLKFHGYQEFPSMQSQILFPVWYGASKLFLIKLIICNHKIILGASLLFST